MIKEKLHCNSSMPYENIKYKRHDQNRRDKINKKKSNVSIHMMSFTGKII